MSWVRSLGWGYRVLYMLVAASVLFNLVVAVAVTVTGRLDLLPQVLASAVLAGGMGLIVEIGRRPLQEGRGR